MKFLTLINCGILFLTLSCHDEAVKLCEPLEVNLLSFRKPEVKAVLNPWLSELQPEPTSEDPTGHRENLSSFVDRLKSGCDLDASIECYACIKTYPLQSEVNIMIDSSGHVMKRVLDISTPESGVMSVVNIHF